MPLPAALLARLAKRGLLEEKNDAKSKKTKTEDVEEVFAEDYDDLAKPDVTPTVQPPIAAKVTPQISQGVVDVVGDEQIFYETTACPNRSNPYHECVAYCKNRYGMHEWDPDIDMIRLRDRMLRKYPLPEGWVEVGDFDTGRFYYWNINTDEVTWLSPGHPKANITRSADILGLVGKIGNLDTLETVDLATRAAFNTDSDSDTSLSDEEDFIEKKRKFQKKGRQGQSKKDDLDPMDPAAYSDIPRGGWSDGLDQRGKAKTGVDSTASGPLFQQRPYPSPGEILRVNQSLKKKK